MIPAIGTMIGCYIFTRMISLAMRKKEPRIVQILSVVTAIVALVMTVALWTALQNPELDGAMSPRWWCLT